MAAVKLMETAGQKKCIVATSECCSAVQCSAVQYRQPGLQPVDLLVLLGALVEVDGVLYVVRGVVLRRPEVGALQRFVSSAHVN